MAHSLSLPPLDGLQAVLAAARTGSFSGAAGQLAITHGAVSRRIAGVEAWAGAALFERHGRGVRLTVEGQRLAAVTEQALELIAAGSPDWRPRRQLDVVRVSIVPSFARLCLLPNLPQLEGSPADLRIECEIDHRHAPLARVDVAIRYGRGGWRDWVAAPLFEETLLPVAAPALACELGPSATVADILRYPLIHDTHTDAWRTWLLHHGRSYRQRVQDRRFADYDLVLQAAASGCGIAVARRPYGQTFLADGRLVPVSGVAVANPMRFYALTQPGSMRRPVRLLVERLVALSAELVNG